LRRVARSPPLVVGLCAGHPAPLHDEAPLPRFQASGLDQGGPGRRSEFGDCRGEFGRCTRQGAGYGCDSRCCYREFASLLCLLCEFQIQFACCVNVRSCRVNEKGAGRDALTSCADRLIPCVGAPACEHWVVACWIPLRTVGAGLLVGWGHLRSRRHHQQVSWDTTFSHWLGDRAACTGTEVRRPVPVASPHDEGFRLRGAGEGSDSAFPHRRRWL
jgi:hypothetical protein